MCHHEDYKVNWPEKMTQRRQLDLAALREHGWSQAEMAADEIERLRVALKRIADYPQGQVFSAGFAPDDAEAMQEIAKAAIVNEQPALRR